MLRPLHELISELWRQGNRMPPITSRQQPPKPTVNFPAGSVLASAVPVTSLKRSKVKLCIYGRNRSGKTTLAAHFPKPILFISSEPDTNGGADSIANMEGVSLIRVSAKKLQGDVVHRSEKVVAIARELAANNPFATVVFDTVTSLQDIIHVELLGLSDVPNSLGWGTVPDGFYQQRSEKLKSTIRPIVDLENCNVVILAQEMDHNASEDRGGKSKLLHTMQQGSFMAPALGATNAKWLQDACGYVVQIYEDEVTEEVRIPQTDAQGKALPEAIQRIGTGKRQRHLRLLYHPNFAAGGRMIYNRDMPEFVTAEDPAGLYEQLAKYVPALQSR